MPATPDRRRRPDATSVGDLGAGGESLDFEDAFRTHSAAVFGLAFRLVGDRSLAEEVTQDVFVLLWRQPGRFDPSRGSLRSYLLTKCHGRSVDVVRHETARRQREERDGRSRKEHQVADVSVEVCDLALHEQVASVVETLPAAEREAIALAYSADVTYREVAVILDTPEGTVKTRIRSGLRRLRLKMSESGLDTT